MQSVKIALPIRLPAPRRLQALPLLMSVALGLMACGPVALAQEVQAPANPADYPAATLAGGVAGQPADASLGTVEAAATPMAPASAAAADQGLVPLAIENDTLIEIEADTLTYDRGQDVATALGNVRIVYGERELRADKVIYDRKVEAMVATGNVRFEDAEGNIAYSPYAEVTGDLRQAFADRIRVLLSDGSRFAATQADRYNGEVTVLDDAVYSPCHVCREDPEKSPLWQIRASKIIHDQRSNDIIYEDARMEVLGIPAFYTPYFRHPDPTVTQRSGFLFPRVGIDANTGAFARVYYYWALGQGQDLTTETYVSSRRGLLLAGDYRQRFERGEIRLQAGGTYGPRDKENPGPGASDVEHVVRGHLFADAQFHLDEEFRIGADINVVSDDTYQQTFDYGGTDVLESRGYLEWFRNRHYGSVEVIAFQDLREDVAETEPAVLPDARLTLVGDPGALLGGTWEVELGALGIQRGDGPDSRRVDGRLAWTRRDLFAPGLQVTSEVGVTGVAYNYADQDQNPVGVTTQSNNGTRARALPFARMEARLPLSRDYSFGRHVMTPIVQGLLAPQLANDDQIPNEDSRDIEFDAGNLFSINRFPGLDRIESGTRVDYALQNDIIFRGGGFLRSFVGQSYRTISDDTLPQNSGLEDRLSDIVGSLSYSPTPMLDFDYRFRLDKDAFDSRRQEVRGRYGTADDFIAGTYVFSSDVDGSNLDDQQQIAVEGRLSLGEYWSIAASHRHELGGTDPDPIETGLVLSYADECFVLSVKGERDYSRRAGLNEGTSISFNVALRNLGSF